MISEDAWKLSEILLYIWFSWRTFSISWTIAAFLVFVPAEMFQVAKQRQKCCYTTAHLDSQAAEKDVLVNCPSLEMIHADCLGNTFK